MPYRSPSIPENERLFLKFPYFNPNAPTFRQPLARLAAGERAEIPLGRLLGIAQWGVTVASDVVWPPSAPITARDGELSSTSGALGASYPPGRAFLRLPEQTLPICDAGSITVGGRLYLVADWHGLDSLSILGYETWWRTGVPPAGDVLAEEGLPAGQGSLGVFVKVAPVRIGLSVIILPAIAALLILAAKALLMGGPILVPAPVP